MLRSFWTVLRGMVPGEQSAVVPGARETLTLRNLGWRSRRYESGQLPPRRGPIRRKWIGTQRSQAPQRPGTRLTRAPTLPRLELIPPTPIAARLKSGQTPIVREPIS